METASQLDRLSPLVDGELRRVVSGRALPLYSMMEHQLGWDVDAQEPGRTRRRLLGALCLAVCEAVSGAAEDALTGSAAIELAQNFCDIHDDLQSGRIERDGRDAVWWRWGPAQAINAGDGMHALARMALLAMMERGFDSDATFDAVRLLDRASLATCEGRFTELEAQERLDMSSDTYLRMARAKTGSMFACAAELGALSARSDGDVRGAFAASGRSLGAALQIGEDLRQLDDSLGEEGTPSDDVMNKRKLYPVVRAFETATPRERRRLGDYYFKRVLEPSDARALAGLVDEMGGMADAREQMETLLSGARESLKSALPDADARAVVETLFDELAAGA